MIILGRYTDNCNDADLRDWFLVDFTGTAGLRDLARCRRRGTYCYIDARNNIRATLRHPKTYKALCYVDFTGHVTVL